MQAVVMGGTATECNALAIPARILLVMGSTVTIRRTDVLVRPCGKPRGTTDEDVRRTPQIGPREVGYGQNNTGRAMLLGLCAIQ